MLRKTLLVFGIAASVLYIAADLLGGAVDPGYSYADQTISELSAIGSPSRPIVLPFFSLYPPLVMAFAIGVWAVAGGARALRAIAALLALYALACLPFAPMHIREVLAAGGGTLTDTMQLVMTGADAILLVAIIAIGAFAFGGAFRVYSIITAIVVVGFGTLSATYGAAVAANLPTPWVGVTERITVYGSMLWLAALGTVLLRQPMPVRGPAGQWPASPTAV